MKILKATNENGFAFEFSIEKAIPQNEGDELIVEGIASTSNIDHDNERMAKDALTNMVEIVNKEGVPLRWEHQKGENAVIGNVFKAWMDDRNAMHIRAVLSKGHPAGPLLHDFLKRGERFGLSVGGKVSDAERELSESTGKYVKTFYKVHLDEVSVTRKPSNYDAWLSEFSKSIKEDELKKYNQVDLYEKFAFQNPEYDYIAQFNKSIPDGDWKSINRSNIISKEKNMKDEKEKKTKAEEEGDKKEEKSYVSEQAFKSFTKKMEGAVVGLTNLIKEMASNALETANPDKKKEETLGDKAKKSLDSEPHDQENPDKDKEETLGDKGKKSRKAQDDEDEEKEKSEDDEEDKEKSEDDEEDEKEKAFGDEDEEDKEKSEDDEEEKDKSADDEDEEKEKSEDDEEDKEKAEDEDKPADTIADATKMIKRLTKALKTKKVTKSVKVERVRKSVDVAEIDSFAKSIAEYINSAQERLGDSGISIPGYAENIAATIRNDKVLQEDIRKMIREPGRKKSVVMGNAYTTTKDGKMLKLSSIDTTAEVRKSHKNLDFKSLYKAEFSGLRENDENN